MGTTHTHHCLFHYVISPLNKLTESGVCTTKTKQQYVILRHFQDIICFCESLFPLIFFVSQRIILNKCEVFLPNP